MYSYMFPSSYEIHEMYFEEYLLICRDIQAYDTVNLDVKVTPKRKGNHGVSVTLDTKELQDISGSDETDVD